MLNEAIQTLQETTPGATIDDSLAPIENLKFLVDSIKEYTSNLKILTEKEEKSIFLEIRLLILQDKCAITQNKVLQSLKEVKDHEEEAHILFVYCIRWHDATRAIKDLMDSLESQLANAYGTYRIVDDRNYTTWTSIAYLQSNFFTIQRKKEDAMRWLL